MMKELDVSIVVPVYNEQDNVKAVFDKNKEVLDKLGLNYEIIFVDDGSTDQTIKRLKNISNPYLKVIQFQGNYGQTAAMDAGFKQAKGKIIISMDGDLQNDPEDIPKMLEKINSGYDVVCGWRKHRKDPLTKHIASRMANIMRKIVLNDTIHDSGCSLKAYRKECFNDLNLFGEMHRFIPALLRWKGFKITEVVVRHHKRRYGTTKYTMKRILRGFLDMILVKFWMKHSSRPMHILGTTGFVFGGLGFLVCLYLTIMKIFYGVGLSDRPLLLLGALLIIVGIQFVMFGVLADILIKIYYKGTTNYTIRRVIDNGTKE